MSKQDQNVLSGMRDFKPIEVARRNYIFETLKNIFINYGFVSIETPSIERLSVLTGKYGEEGDKLLFNVFNSGSSDDFKEGIISPNKALRYDLTVPFARFVVNHKNEITFPFKRFQIQNVWRGDRPQKGRYREFTQCDCDVIGSDSLIHEAELALIYHEAFHKLGIHDFCIHINNRKILNGIVEVLGCSEYFKTICIAIDKFDKIGSEGVRKDLIQRNLSEQKTDEVLQFLNFKGTNDELLNFLSDKLKKSEQGMKGLEEMLSIFKFLKLYFSISQLPAEFRIDLTLARGLDYYTGTIFEVTVNNVAIGSVGGGGRYDNLTDFFGLKGMTGVGISFGADRIYDVMTELNLFSNIKEPSSKILFINFEENALPIILDTAYKLRKNNIPTEVFPQTTRKLDKQFTYADKKKIPYVVIIGENELANGRIKIKNMINGLQFDIDINESVQQIIEIIQNSDFDTIL